MRIESATGSGATVNAPASNHARGAKADRRNSAGPSASAAAGAAGDSGNRGLHLGQIKKMMRDAGSSSSSVDLQALQGLTSRLNDVMERLDSLTGIVGQAAGGATGGTTSGTGTTTTTGTTSGAGGSTTGAGGSTTSGAGGAGGTGGTGGTGTTSSTASSTFNLIHPFQGPTDFGSITINGVTTNFGVIDAKSGLTSNQVASSLVNIINSNPDNTVTAQQRDNKIMLVSKTAGEGITIDDISLGTSSGTLSGFAGFLDGMSGSGTLLSNPISPIRR